MWLTSELSAFWALHGSLGNIMHLLCSWRWVTQDILISPLWLLNAIRKETDGVVMPGAPVNTIQKEGHFTEENQA